MSRIKKKRNKKYVSRKSLLPIESRSELVLQNWKLARKIISFIGVFLVGINLLVGIILEQRITDRLNSITDSSTFNLYLTFILLVAVFRIILALWMRKNQGLMNQDVEIAKKAVTLFIVSTIIAIAIFITPILYLSGLSTYAFELLLPHFPALKGWIIDAVLWVLQASLAGIIGNFSYGKLKRRK